MQDGNGSDEETYIAAELAQGWDVNVPDYEGLDSEWAVGPTLGRATLDSIRAVEHFASDGLTAGKKTKVGLTGYSGGSEAAEWAGSLAPRYPRAEPGRDRGRRQLPRLRLHDGPSRGSVWYGTEIGTMESFSRAYRDFQLTKFLNTAGLALAAADGQDASGCAGSTLNEPYGNASQFTRFPSSAAMAANPLFKRVMARLSLRYAPYPRAASTWPRSRGSGPGRSSISRTGSRETRRPITASPTAGSRPRRSAEPRPPPVPPALLTFELDGVSGARHHDPMAAPTAPELRDSTEDEVAQRRRLLMSLLDDADALAARGAGAMRTQLPAYAAQDERFDADVLDQVRRNTRAILTAMIEGRDASADDHAFQRSAAMRRARSGFALEDYLSAYRVGQKVMWDAMAAAAEEQQVSPRVVFWLASHLMHHIDYAAEHAAQSYVEFRQHGLADAARERRDLLEHLLAGRLPETGPLAAAAERFGIGANTPALLAVAVPLTADETEEGPTLASASLARAGLHETTSLVVVRQSEIVAVMTLGHDRDPEPLIVRLERAEKLLRAEGVPLAIGVSATAETIGELPEAYGEALTAVRFVGKDGGVGSLTRLSSFEYLALCADSTAHRLQDPQVAHFLRDDWNRGGVLIATIRAYAEADMNLKEAAANLHVHPNTAQYRFQRVEELCGLNPKRFADLHSLIVAIAIDDGSTCR